MVIRTPQTEIDAYFADTEHLSQGKLKKILKGVDIYNKDDDERELYYEEKEHLNVGNGVDVRLTQGIEEFERQFAIILVEKPGAKLMSVVQFIFDRFIRDKDEEQIRHSTLSLSVPPADILDAASAEDYQRRYKDETVISKIITDTEDYFDALCINHGKQLLSPEEAGTINGISTSLYNNSLTMKLFNGNHPDHIDIYYQLPVYFTIDNIPCKALFDIVLIDHVEKTITPYDLKTMSDYTVNFVKSVMRFRYDIQAAFYTQALIQEIANSSSIPFEQSLRDRQSFDGYSNAPFKFVVESSKEQGNPLVYKCTSDILAMGIYGRPEGHTLLHTNNEQDSRGIFHQAVHGYKYAMELYKWHQENGFEQDRLVVQNQGFMNLDWNRSY